MPGDTVTVTVTVTNEDTYVTGVTYNEDECDETDGKYTFTMPAENVTIAVQTGTYEEVLSDGNDSLNAYNVYTIAQNGSYSPRVGTDTENVWKILADISWGVRDLYCGAVLGDEIFLSAEEELGFCLMKSFAARRRRASFGIGSFFTS